MADRTIESTLDRPLDPAAEAVGDAGADAEIEAGRGVAMNVCAEWLLRLANGERVPPSSGEPVAGNP